MKFKKSKYLDKNIKVAKQKTPFGTFYFSITLESNGKYSFESVVESDFGGDTCVISSFKDRTETFNEAAYKVVRYTKDWLYNDKQYNNTIQAIGILEDLTGTF